MKKNKIFMLAVLVWLISFQSTAQATPPYQVCNTNPNLTFSIDWTVTGPLGNQHGSFVLGPNTCITIPNSAYSIVGCTPTLCGETEIQVTHVNFSPNTGGGLPTISSAGQGGCKTCFNPCPPLCVTSMNWTSNLCTIN